MAPHDLSVGDPSPAMLQFDRSGRHLTVYLTGELDAATAPGVGAAISAHIGPHDQRVWLDVSALEFCDSSGVALLFRLHHAVDAVGGRLVIYCPPPQLRKLLDVADPHHLLALRE